MIGLVAVLAAASVCLSLVTLDNVKDVALADVMHSRPVSVRGMLGAVGLLDVLFGLVAVAALAGLAVMEWRGRAMSLALRTLTERQAVVLLTILVAWFGHAYLGPGLLLGGDTATHIARFMEMRRGLDAGTLPFWTNDQYLGSPLLWFTGPFTYLVGGALAFIVRDAVVVAKLIYFSMHMVSGWMFYAVVRRFGVRPAAALVVGVAFAGSFAKLHMFLYRGVLPQAFTVAFFLVLFFAADGLMRGVGRRWVNALLFSLATFGLIVNHQPHALFAATYLAVFGAVAVLGGWWQWRRAPVLVAAGVVAVVASIVAVVPIVAEASWVMIEPESGIFMLQWPTPARLLKLVRWGNTGILPGYDYWAYLGLGSIVLAVAGMVGAVRGRLRADSAWVARPAMVCLALCLVLYNPVVRDIMFLLFFTALLAAVGLDWLIDRPVLAGRRLLALVAVLLLDLVSTAVQPVTRTDKEYLVAAGRRIEQTMPDHRVIEIGIDRAGGMDAVIGPTGTPMGYDALVQRVAGNHNMAATLVHNYALTLIKQTEQELVTTGRLSGATRALLRMLNVGRVVCSSPIGNGCPERVQDTVDDPVLGRTVVVAGTPALFSQRLVVSGVSGVHDKPMLGAGDWSYGRPDDVVDATATDLARILAEERPDPARPLAAAIAIRGTLPDRTIATVSAPAVTIERYVVGLDRVRLTLRSDAAGYVQLAHPWIPSMRVLLDGQVVTPLRGALNLMVVPVAAGTSEIVLQEGWTTVRRVSALVSLVGLVGMGLMTLVLVRMDRRRLG